MPNDKTTMRDNCLRWDIGPSPLAGYQNSLQLAASAVLADDLVIGIAPALLISTSGYSSKNRRSGSKANASKRRSPAKYGRRYSRFSSLEMLGNAPTTSLMMASAFVVYYANYALFLTGSRPGGAAPGGDRGSSIDSPLEGDGFELLVPRIIMPAVRCGRGCRARFRRLYSQPRSASAGSDQHRTARRFEVPHLVARCGGSAARPDEAINQRRVCPVVW